MGFIFGLLFAIIFLIVLIRFPRQTLSVIGLLIVGIIILWHTTITIPENARKARDGKIQLLVSYNTEVCSPEYPLNIVIVNKSDKTIADTNWELAAYIPGHSSNLVDYSGEDYSCDKIIKAGESWSICYKLPEKLESSNYELGKLEYKIQYRRFNFQ